ncbi:hypothetical protein CC80DRAFT_409232, partial [Byssothecium circinans]
GRTITPSRKRINQWYSTKRIMVEWGIGGVKNNFKYLSYKQGLCVGLCPVACYLPVFAFLFNCRTCMRRGNQLSEMFDLLPPELEEYVYTEGARPLEGAVVGAGFGVSYEW